MENTLIMNKLPLPAEFDGHVWNTVFKPTRKSIPKYLHEDLPELKLMELKEKFKQMGKFNVPKLDYFDDLLKKRKKSQPQDKKVLYSGRVTYNTVKEQLQYALIMCDRQSSLIDELVNKAKSIKKTHQKNSKGKIRVNKSVKKQKLDNYFDGTIDLVFRNRKNMYIQSLKKGAPPSSNPEIEKAVNSIKLIDLHSNN